MNIFKKVITITFIMVICSIVLAKVIASQIPQHIEHIIKNTDLQPAIAGLEVGLGYMAKFMIMIP